MTECEGRYEGGGRRERREEGGGEKKEDTYHALPDEGQERFLIASHIDQEVEETVLCVRVCMHVRVWVHACAWVHVRL